MATEGLESRFVRSFALVLGLLAAGAALGQTIDVVDYSDTFTVAEWGGVPQRADGSYNTGSPAYDVEDPHGNPVSTWTPQSNYSFNSIATSFGAGPVLLPGSSGNPGAVSGMAQSGGGDFSFAYGIRENYIVEFDAFVSPFDRTDLSSVPSPGAGIFSSPSLSVFFRRSSVGFIGIFNGAFETWATDADGNPASTGVADDNWHKLAVHFDKPHDRLRIYVDGAVKADLDLVTFAGGAYRDYSNAAVGMGGEGSDWGGGRVLWFDNFRVGGPAGLNPCFTASPTEGVEPLAVHLDATCSRLTGAPAESFQWDFDDGTIANGEVVDHVFTAPGKYTVTLTVTNGIETASVSKGVVVYGRVLTYSDGFDRPDGPATEWTVNQGATWAIAGGKLVAGPTGEEHFIWAGDPPVVGPPNSVFEFRHEFLAAGTYPPVGRHGGFQFHCTRPTRRTGGSAFSGYFIDWIDRAEDRGIRLTRDDNGTLVLLVAGQGAAAPANPPTRYRVVTEGARIRVYGDDVLTIDVLDDTYRGGHFGFWTWEQGQQVAIDDVTLNGTPLYACFKSAPSFPLSGAPVLLDGTCSGVFDGSTSIAKYQWDLGDGTAATTPTVDHVYAGAGTYTVSLTVEDSAGAKASLAKPVTVAANLAPLVACFDSAAALGDWTAPLGTWTVTGSHILQVATGGGEGFLYAGNPPRYLPPSFVAEVEWRLSANAGAPVGRHAAVHFFWNKATTNRFAGDTRGYSLFYIDRASDRGLTLVRFSFGGLVTLNPPGGTPGLTEPPATVRIQVSGPRIVVYADGVPVIDVLDATYRDGLFGLWSYAQNVNLFDNVRIWDGAEPARCPGTPALAGDCTSDGEQDVSDLVCYVEHLFRGFNLLDRTVPPLPCAPTELSAPSNVAILDLNGDRRVDVSDIVTLATYLFLGGAPPVQGADCFGVSDFYGCVENPGCP